MFRINFYFFVVVLLFSCASNKWQVSDADFPVRVAGVVFSDGVLDIDNSKDFGLWRVGMPLLQNSTATLDDNGLIRISGLTCRNISVNISADVCHIVFPSQNYAGSFSCRIVMRTEDGIPQFDIGCPRELIRF